MTVAHTDIRSTQRLLAAGTTTPQELAKQCLGQVARLNPTLRAMIAVNPDAQRTAADSARTVQHASGAMHGIPIVVKDNIETADGLPTTAGSLVLADNVTHRDAPCVANLRANGALILGKSNLSEWANYRSYEPTSGWSAVGGQTRNPFDPTRSPCGSSSGSAVAVASGMAFAGIGTETNGSIVCPAAVNGLVGFKPSLGVVDPTHIVPISLTQDTAGPITRSVLDAAIVLSAMTGSDYEPDIVDLEHLRIGVLDSSAGFHDSVQSTFDNVLRLLEQRDVTLVRGLRFQRVDGLPEAAPMVLRCEFAQALNGYFATLPGPLSRLTLSAIIEFNERHADRELIHFGQELFEDAANSEGTGSAGYRDALTLARRATGEQGIDHLLGEHEVNCLIGATGAPAWPIDWVAGDVVGGGGVPGHAAICGYPHLTVPMGLVDGLPVGLSVIGAARADRHVLGVGLAIEETLDVHLHPALAR